jgi:hypothetical protein
MGHFFIWSWFIGAINLYTSCSMELYKCSFLKLSGTAGEKSISGNGTEMGRWQLKETLSKLDAFLFVRFFLQFFLKVRFLSQ